MNTKVIKLPDIRSSIRDEFPLLRKRINGKPILYLDSASTALKPTCVLEAIRKYYEQETANVHRSTHPLGEAVTVSYENARNRVARFLHARPDEIIFVRNTTEAINLVSYGIGLTKQDEILITPLEHHSNQLPWLSRAGVKYVPLGSDDLPDSEQIPFLVTHNTRLLAVSLLSNVTGIQNPIHKWVSLAQEKKIPLLVDAAQAAGHMPLDVQRLGCDFLAFSGHKVCGPSGIGVLWGRREQLAKMVPSLLGGGMVHESRLDGYQIKEPPHCFEAGTPNIEGALGLAAALKFMENIGMNHVENHSRELGERLYDGLKEIPNIKLIAQEKRDRYGIASFFIKIPGLSAEALGRMLADTHGIMLSTGMHCTHPYHGLLNFPATVRASTQVYNTTEEVETFLGALRGIFGGA